MKNFLTLFLCVLLSSLHAQAQRYTIKGSVIDMENNEPAFEATVQLLALPDSSFVTGATTRDNGSFEFHEIKKGHYAIKISSIGYLTHVQGVNTFNAKSSVIELGRLALVADNQMLNEVLVTANVSKMQASGDSLIFNAGAYRTPEGSTLEALVRQLPGAEVDDNGNITINGKSVTKILVDGKEFFLNDVNVAMKNIPTDIIDKIKTYERKSDLARITGIDDGEEETVLDLSIKSDKKGGWFGNLNLGLGTKERYNNRGMVNRFNDLGQISTFGNMRNTPNRWGRNNGLRTFREVGTNFSTSTKKLDTNGNLRFRYEGSDVRNESTSENFAAARGAFSDSRNVSMTSNASVNGDLKLEWKPDTMSNILFRPNFSFSRNRGYNSNESGAYDVDPNQTRADELLEYTVNTNVSNSQSYNSNKTVGGELQVNRRLNISGRNITVRFTGRYSEGQDKQISAAYITYNTQGTSQTNNRHFDTPTQNYNYSGELTYNEPIAKQTYLQFAYRIAQNYNKNDRHAYIYDTPAYQDLTDAIDHYKYDINGILNLMQEAQHLTEASSKLGRFAEYRSTNQRLSLQFQRIHNGMNLTLGLNAHPQQTTLNYEYMDMKFPEVKRRVFNLAPRMNLKWDFDEHTSLRLRYNGRTSQPGMTSLLDITDDSNPLNIRKGNPNLRPAFSNNFNGDYHTYNVEAQRGIWSWIWGNTTSNDIRDKTTYDKETGVRTTIPMNINGNWNLGGGAGMNTGLGEKKHFFVGGHLGSSFNHNVGFYNNTSQTEEDNLDIKSITKNISVFGRLSTGYRIDKLNIELRADANMSHMENNVTKPENPTTVGFSYGTNMQWTMPWGTELATDMRMNSRRGYSQKEMNTNELVWNASISHAFLRGKALTLKAEMFDILGQQTNISRMVNAFMRSDSRTNSIYQYALFSAIFRFSVFGGKNVMGTDKERS